LRFDEITLPEAHESEFQPNQRHVQPGGELIAQLSALPFIVPRGVDLLLAPFQVEPRELRDGVVQGRCADVVGEDSSRRR